MHFEYKSIELKTKLNTNAPCYDTAKSLCDGFNEIIEKNKYNKSEDIDKAFDSYLKDVPNNLVVACKLYFEVEHKESVEKNKVKEKSQLEM